MGGRERGTIDLIIEMPRCAPREPLTVAKPSRAAGVTVEASTVPAAEERDRRRKDGVDARREPVEGEVHVGTGGADNKA